MKYLATVLSAVASLVVPCGDVRAEELAPLAGRSVALGEMRGIAYYRPGGAGFEVVIILADGPAGRPVRFMTTLSPGQATVISSPGTLGQQATIVTITRDADRILVDGGSARAQDDAALAEEESKQ